MSDDGDVAESWKTRLLRWRLNCFPAYRGTGAFITRIAADFGTVRIVVPLSWRTRNYVGTIFGGAMFGALDPIYMVMLIHLLGPKYLVWDKTASIQFLKPGRSTLRATFRVPEAEVAEIRRLLESERSLDRHYQVELVDGAGGVVARMDKTLYVRLKDRPAES